MKRFGNLLKDRTFLNSCLIALIFLIASLFVNYYAGIFATEHESNPVTDIVLSNTPAFDVDEFFIYGPVVFWIFTAVILVRNPEYIPFALKSIALFVLIRSGFISLTHLGPFAGRTSDSSNFLLNRLTFGGDLFFSGHTGLPFLMALIYWRHYILRWIFLISSVFFGIVVLLGHYHYTIDVASAFFITYSIYHLARVFFKKDFVRMVPLSAANYSL